MIKQELINLFQECINMYDGEYGAVNYNINDIREEFGEYSVSMNHDQKQKRIVCFAGSTSIKDWYSNFRICKQTIAYDNKESPIRVHEGFYQSYLKIREELQRYIKNSDEIDFVAHSRGGALAQLAAVDLQYCSTTPKKIRVFVFGSPMLFNQAGADSYNKRVPDTFNFVYRNDLVSKSPPFFYAPTGWIIRFKEKEKDGKFFCHYPVNYKLAIRNQLGEKDLSEIS